MSFDSNIIKFLNDSNSEFTSTREAELKRNLVSAVEQTKGNIVSALDVMLIHDEELRNEWNYEAKKAGKSQASYPVLARNLFQAGKIDEKTYQRAAGVLDTITNPGGANFLQTTVADFVAETVEELGIVANTVTKIDLAGEGNLQIPVNNSFAMSNFVANAANYTDLGSTIEGGISSVTLNPQKVGAYQQLRPDFLNKLSANRLQYIVRLLADAQARAYDNAIINGNGTTPNPTGMNQNALTAFPIGGDEFETLLNAVSAISDVRKGRDRDIVVFMNTAAKNRFLQLKYVLSNDRSGLIDANGSGLQSIAGYKVVVTDVINNTGTAGSKSTTVTLGYANQYYWGDSKKPTIATDQSVGFLSGTDTVRIDGMADGKPTFNNAFAKFDITNVA